MMPNLRTSLFCGLMAGLLANSFVVAADEAAQPNPTVAATTGAAAPAAGAAAAAAKPKYPAFADLLGEADTVEGLIKMYRKDGKLYGEIAPGQLNRDFIVLISIARGIGEGSLLGGMTWNFGDDWLWQFRKEDDEIFIVRRNVRFTAAKGSPEEKAVGLAYTDSVLFNLPIATMSAAGGYVVDLTSVFMSDLPQISRTLGGFAFSPSKSVWHEVKGFTDNVELEVAATYASSGSTELDTVADSRGVTVNVHYSISLLPQTGYQPRMADDRVGYFLTVVKDYSKQGNEDRFVRYINRWDLKKKDPAAEISPPEKPIVFYLERTIPVKYRKPIRDGILEWNKAFEKAGFYDAVQVIQQEDNADWDPEDIRYNTFRWITSGAGFAMGPSRVNPTTGQILDADIIFDSDFIQFWKHEYENFNLQGVAGLTGGPLDLTEYAEAKKHHAHGHRCNCGCELNHGMSYQYALGAAALQIRAGDIGAAKPLEEKMIMQGLKEVTMHEVGHTLGLRHNFKASTTLSLADINNPEITKNIGLTSSVMDYAPVNISPKGQPQGDFYSTTIGPYDIWAIEYGYKPIGGDETEALGKIASRSAEPELAYATDEDTRGTDSDPLSYRFDLGNDTVAYAKWRAQVINELWPGLADRVTADGEGYQKARQAFGVLLSNYGTSMFMASRNIGGLYVNRDHKGDPGARPPFVVVPAEKQREALALLEEYVFSDKPFNFPPELYNHLAASRWNHWGMNDVPRLDYKIHEVIAIWQ
ncbi:MAG: zinc-dependent metalloprotease, partial [Pirellulales bacterium]